MNNLHQSHLGWAVNSLKSAIPAFLSLGYTTDGDICVDNTRKVELILLTDSDGNTIELVAPIADDSPVSGILKANGPAPYHVCFSMNVEKGFDNYKKEFGKMDLSCCMNSHRPRFCRKRMSSFYIHSI